MKELPRRHVTSDLDIIMRLSCAYLQLTYPMPVRRVIVYPYDLPPRPTYVHRNRVSWLTLQTRLSITGTAHAQFRKPSDMRSIRVTRPQVRRSRPRCFDQ